MPKIFGRDPTLWLSFLTGVVLLLGTFGFHFLSGAQAGLISAGIIALAGAANAALVRPIAPAAFTYLLGAVIAIAAAYGLKVNADTLAMLNALVVPALALITRAQVSPLETAVTSA